ncbi:tripartite tricarboxylate transporter substrate binding protein [Aquabacterium sp.]|uniref:tripartite tricarboxylate transporter substrate binding protein n=1 Tax=Aquabacterium sp. TaxID=1872578 RepID=UPI00378314EC
MAFNKLLGAIAATLLCAATATASAQGFPDKLVRIVVPAPPGGSQDVVARLLAEQLQPAFGQPVIIENKPGAVGMLGVQELLNAPHDGYTVLMHISGIVSEIPYLTKPRYDPFKDIKPLVQLARSGLVFVGNPQLPAPALKDVVGYVKAHPGKVSFASYSSGSLSHTLGVEFNQLAGLDMTHVGYKGSPPALQDVMGGHVQFMFDGPGTSVPMVKAGKLKAYAVTTSQRIPALPDVPTFTELGYPAMTVVSWFGLWLTPDVPAPVQARLRDAALKAMQSPVYRERLAALGMEPGLPATPEDLAKSLRIAYERQGSLLKSIDFKPE